MTFGPLRTALSAAVEGVGLRGRAERAAPALATVNPMAAPAGPTLGNYPNTTVALSGGVTITPNVAPTDAVGINVSTDTNFKGTFTADPSTGVVRVINAHPAGTYNVTVRAFSNTGSVTTTTFTLTVQAGTACAGVTQFSSAPDVGVGTNPYSLAVGDFNNDGKQDFATANRNSNTVSVRLGNGAGGFTGSTSISISGNPSAVAVGDFNNDGKQDLAVGTNALSANSVAIRLGDGAGNFTGSTSVSVGNTPSAVAVGDFNSDGRQDLAAVNYFSNTVSIRLGDGAGGFTGTTNVPVGSNPHYISIADFNNDGKQDFAVVNLSSNAVSVRLGDGAGGFTGSTEVSVGENPNGIATGDFNGDGKQDFAVAMISLSIVVIRLGDGAGGFTAAPNVNAGGVPKSVAAADFNKDGKTDLAVTNNDPFLKTVSIRFGNGAGGFTGSTALSVGPSPVAVAIGDFNNDGSQDFAVANYDSHNVSVRLGGCNIPPTLTVATGLTRQQGSPVSNSIIATVTDDGGNGNVTVSVAQPNPVNGVTIANIVNTNGIITADILAGCAASNATFILQATDGGSLVQSTLNVSVTANTAPALAYTTTQAISFNDSLTVTPTGASDSGPVTYQVLAGHGLITAPTVNSSGVVSITGARPAGAHTITVRATDACGLTTDASFTLNVSNASLSVNDVSLAEGDSGTKSFNFTVTLAEASNLTVRVDYATGAGTASAGSDYQTASGTLTFAPGDLTRTVTVTVNGDTSDEANETFLVNLTNPVNATIGDTQGLGTILNDDAPTVQFNANSFSFAEGAGHGDIIVTRTGDLSKALTVDYQTSDQSGMTPCQTNNTGFASDRCDYATAAGAIRFAAGEAQKTITLILINDAYVEGTEQLTARLINPQGGSVGADTATINITDDDSQTASTNPIEDQGFFLRMQYLDFLGREPDASGFQFWMNRMNGVTCPPGETCDRIDTAKRIFESDEFQERGFYVYSLFDATLGRFPKYAEFIPDVARLNGYQSVTEQRLGKDAYLLDFMNKPEFRNLYDVYLTGDHREAVDAEGFVNALCQKAGVTPASKQTLISNLQNKVKDPAHTLEDFILTPEINGVGGRYYDRARIVMQYFGFLRRDPEAGGFDFWWDRLTKPEFGHFHDYRWMIEGFLKSDEYHYRFAQISATP